MSKHKMRKKKYGIINSKSIKYLEQFRRFSKCESLEVFLKLNQYKRREIVKDYLNEINRMSPELMILEKTLCIFTFFYKKNKLPTSLQELMPTHPIYTTPHTTTIGN